MKNIVIAFALFMSMAASAEKLVVENNIPQNVAFRFHYQFPGAQEVTWQKNDNNYTAIYFESGKKISVYYASNGDCVEIDREISAHQLPAGYKDMIVKHLDGNVQFDNVTAIDDFSGSPYYVIEVIKNNKKYTYELSAAQGEDVILCDLRQGTVVW